VTGVKIADALAGAMESWLLTNVGSATENEIDHLRRNFQAPTHEPVDYDRFGPAFARAYHTINFRKCLAALRASAPNPAAQLVDLGCGSGAAAAAALAYYSDRTDSPDAVDVLLIDKCKTQIDLAADLISAIAVELPMKVNVRAEVADWPPETHASGKSSLVLAAHVLTENIRRAHDFLAAAEALTGPSGALVVIERKDDPVWSTVDHHVARSASARLHGSCAVTAAGPRVGNRQWHTKWIMLLHPPCSILADATQRYFEAWRAKDPELLADVFTSGALYWDKPFKEPVRGLDGIVEYWRTEVAPQHEPVVDIISIAYGPQSTYVEWGAKFTRAGKTRELRGTMVLEVERGSGLIRELREYYRSTPPEDRFDQVRCTGSGDHRRR
jgi:hypothetical protein